MKLRKGALAVAGLLIAFSACDDDIVSPEEPLDPDTAPRVTIDRFSDDAATLFQRSAMPSLPAAGQAIDMDQAPFITQGLGPEGRTVRYYNFDVMTTDPAPIYVLFREGENAPVSGQLNIVDVVPGDDGYNDFWQVVRVTVPDDYVANTVTSLAEILAEGYEMAMTTTLVNCPIVPEGSTASGGGGANGLTRGWYRDQVVFYFNFDEAALTTTDADAVPTSPIYVTFNVNPDEPGGGPASGFLTEDGTVQTHNVIATLPDDDAYSPLWAVIPYDNSSFDDVEDLQSAEAAPDFGVAAMVNCPVVFVGS